jgi:hypothetical protein
VLPVLRASLGSRLRSMRHSICIAIIVTTSSARADVSGQLSAGAGTETSTTSFATASGTLAVDFSHAAAPVEHRGLSWSSAGETCWFWTGTDDDDRNGVHAEASATSVASTVIGTARAAARGYGWELDAGLTYQPTGDLRDSFWRSGRGILASTLELQMPAMVTAGTRTTRWGIAAVDVSITDRERWPGAPLIDGGLDAAVEIPVVHAISSSWTADILAVHTTGHQVVESETATTVTELSAVEVGFDVLALRLKLSPSLVLAARGGFDITQPMVEVTSQVNPTMYSDGPVVPRVTSPRYWLELTERTGERVASLGGGSWARLDPSGTAADAGQLMTASYADRFGPLDVRATMQAGRLRRYLISPYASPNVEPVGTVMWMGRGELTASVPLGKGVELASDAYVERSDRDDPRWIVPADGTLATHAGADVTARWQFRQL